MTEGKEDKRVKIKKVRLTELRRGKKLFLSTGISKVKITDLIEVAGEQDYQEVSMIEIPIQSTGISELMETFQEKAPTPPTVSMLVDPNGKNAEIAKDLGMTKKDWIKIPDYNDKKYLETKSEHDNNLGQAILLKGMNIILTEEDGTIITDGNEKIKVLKEAGMSGDQFQQVVNDITSLTKWTEEEKYNFLD